MSPEMGRGQCAGNVGVGTSRELGEGEGRGERWILTVCSDLSISYLHLKSEDEITLEALVLNLGRSIHLL